MKDSDFEHRVNSKSASPSPHDSSRDIIEDDMMSPPSVTPIISPPPAFQDPNRQVYGTVRRSNGSSKPHFLSRSNAIVVSPPPSPSHIPTANWSTLPSPRSLAAAAAAVSSSSYFKMNHKVSPITTPTQQSSIHSRIPQTKSLEDKTSSARRSQFQRYDSSSSSSSSFGFRSLDSNINARTAMPRLSETDSSIGGYEDGDEEETITPSKTVPPSLKDVISLSPDTPTGQGGQIKERSSLVHADKISPSSLRHANRFNHQRIHPPRRSPGSEGSSGKKKNSNHSTSSTSSSSSSSSLSSCGAGTGSRGVSSGSLAQSQAFRRSVSHSLAKQQSSTRNIIESIPHGYHTWDGRNRVRRSRSLQLPETKSPGALSPSSFSNTEYQHLAKQQHQPQPQHHYPQQQTEPHRVTVKIGGNEQSQERPRRPFIQHRKAQSEDNRYQDGFLRWEDEARAVTDYLHGTRSRAAARALLQAHYHSTTDHGSSELQDASHEQQPSGFNIIVVSSRGNKVKTQSQRQQRILQRGITTPTTPGTGSSFDLNPCTPNTCDFWPHCAHRDSLYPPITNSSLHNKSSSLSPGSSSGSKLPSVQPSATSSTGSSIRLSQTYPSTTKASTSVQRGRSSDSKHIYESDIKASKIPEGSVEGHDIFNPLSDHKNSYQYMHSNRAKNGPNEIVGSSLEKRLVTTPENEDKKFKSKSIGRQQHYSHCQTQKHSGNYSSISDKIKSNVINKASSVISYPTDSEKCDQYKGEPTSAFGVASGLVFNQQDSGICGKSATSPIMDIQEIENSVSKDSKLSPSGCTNTARSPASSASSSSSDVWVTTSDRTVTKSPRMAQRSSGTSTPQDDALSMGGLGGKSPLQERDKSVLGPRPGSAPAAEPEDARYKRSTPLDSQQRSLSLPKSFLSERASPAAFTPAEIIIAPKQSHLFSWKPRERENHVANKRMKSPSTEVPLTARIPARDPSITGQETSHYQPPSTMSKSIRHNKDAANIPAEDPVASRSDWDIRRPWSNASSDNEPIPASSCHQTEGAYTNQRLAGKKDLSQSQHNLSGAASESVLQKFRKNLVMKFHKKGSKSDADSTEEKTDERSLDEEEPVQTQDETTESSTFLPQQGKDEANVNTKFKFGPLVWRSSKEGKKGKKTNTSDSVDGSKTEIHTESTSEQRDAENECGNDVKQANIQTEESLKQNKDKLPFQVDLLSRPQNQHHHHVRRTNSDLSGQRLLNWDIRSNYRRMFSTPSPIKMRPSHTTDPQQHESIQIRKSKQRSRRPHLRRSISQPLGLNDLSSLMCQRTGAVIMGQRKLNISSEDEHDIPAGVSDDEIMSDSESSIASSLTDRKKSFEQGLDDTVVAWAEAVWDHVAMEPEELAFRAGDVIEVVDANDKDWWWGSRGPVSGWFPAAFVRLRVSQENTVEDCLAAMAAGATSHIQLRQRTSVSLLSNDEVRSRVVRELISTERDFVKILTDVVEGYLKECKKRTEMFSSQHINRIFGNLEELLEFQSAFVNDLENCVDKDSPHKSCIGECFLSHKEGFQIYSEYCNTHPMAIATLQELYERENYSRFFEACRLMRGLMEIPLDGYLLTPVQRICKYPLQLAELLKYTKTDHPDYSTLQEALDTMRNVAILINERKRRMESLEKLAAWQQRVEAWEGEDLIETSTQLIHQGEVTRMTTGMWTSNVTLFLFDHQLIYCKKDILKRNTYVYKGRIQLDTSEVIDVPDGKDPQLGVMMKHGLKVYCYVRDKWLLFCCRTTEEKQAWLDALAEERKLVAKDQLDGLELPPAARQLARMAARCQRRPPHKPRGKSYKRSRTYRNRTQNVSQHNISGSQSSSHSLARIGMWFSFGSNKKGRPVI